MPLYEFVCDCGCRFEELFRTPQAGATCACPDCGGAGRRVISRVNVVGHASPGPDRSTWPTTWRATGGGNPDLVRAWHRAIETRMRHEDRDPGLGTQPAAPVYSHEGGRLIPAPGPGGGGPGPAAVPHGHGHGHAHPHPPSQGGARDGGAGGVASTPAP